jgi:hypothetical protein
MSEKKSGKKEENFIERASPYRALSGTNLPVLFKRCVCVSGCLATED